MDNFRRASLYVKELPVNARRLETSDYNTTIVKNVYIPLVSNPYSLSSNEIDTNAYGVAYIKFCNSNGALATSISGGYNYTAAATLTQDHAWFSCDYSSMYIDFGYTGEWITESGYGYYMNISFMRYFSEGPNPMFSLKSGGSSNNPNLPIELLEENVTLDNPIYVCVSCKAISPQPNAYPYMKFLGGRINPTQPYGQSTPSTSVLMKYPIYIEPVE